MELKSYSDWKKVKSGTVVRYKSEPRDSAHPCEILGIVRHSRDDSLQFKCIWSEGYDPDFKDWKDFLPVDYGWSVDEVGIVKKILENYGEA